ncbi:MAG: AEC family transporter [Chloroflexi bacterium]|nr:AEC family transporter [Chloroflexota bacterium]MBU1748764.1 AEC family transporter [Chloroflexota bacterium]MBU1879499.1 AEC family transporter [Chloroflexota bacterium]
MTFLFNVILPILLVAGVAALAQRWLRIDVRPLSRVVFYLFTPALVFDSLSRSTVNGSEFLQISTVAVLVTATLWVLGAVLARWLRLEGPTRSAFLLTLLLINAGNYGLPATQFAFGDEGLARATIYFTISATISASLGVYLAARGRASTGLALRRLVAVPMVYAAALGLAFNLAHLALPEPIDKAVGLLGQGAVPAFLVVLGLQLAHTFGARRQTLHLPALTIVAVGRLLLAPALALLLAVALGLPVLTRNVVLLESAMPSAVMGTILATEFDADPGFVTLAVFVTTLASVLTLTLWLNLMTIL